MPNADTFGGAVTTCAHSGGTDPTPAERCPACAAESTAERRTLFELLVEVSWRRVLRTSGPAVLVALVGAQLLAVPSLFAGGRLLGFPSSAAGHGLGAWVRLVAALVAATFGSSLHAGADPSELTAVPLALTLAVLATLWTVHRRTRATPATVRERIAQAVRPALVITAFAVAAAVVAGTGPGGSSAAPVRTLWWAGVLTIGTALAAEFAPVRSVRRRLRPGSRTSAALEGWAPAVRAALGTLAVGLVLGYAAAIGAAFAEHARLGLTVADVARALPESVGYLGILGSSVLGIAVGGVAGTHPGPVLALYDRHGLSAGYWLLLALPVLSVGIGARWVVHRYRERLSDRQLVRACYRMAGPLALLFLAVAVPSRISVAAGGSIAGLGPRLGEDAVLAASTLVGGYLAGRLALRTTPAPETRPVTAGEPGVGPGAEVLGSPPRAARGPRVARPTGTAVLVALLVAFVALAGSAVVRHGARAATGPPLGTTLPATAIAVGGQPGADTVVPAPGPGLLGFPGGGGTISPDAAHALESTAVAEVSVRGSEGTFTTDLGDLLRHGLVVPAGVTVIVQRADAVSFCAVAVLDTGEQDSMSSADGTIVSGDTC